VWIFSQLLENLQESDLRFLIENKVGESATLEYKRDMWGNSDADKRELLRDVASMANAEGGVIIVGMDQTPEGIARELVAVPGASGHADRIRDSCLAGISERVPGLQARAVPFAKGELIVVRIPRSYRRPHMITFEGRNDFWVRHDQQKGRMSIAEVKAAVTSTEDLTMKAERFIDARRSHVSPYGLAITGTPLSLEEGRVDISDPRLVQLLREPPPARGVEDVLFLESGGRVMPSIRGRVRRSQEESLEIFRSGHIEFLLNSNRVLWNAGPRSHLLGARIAAYLAHFARFVEAVRAMSGIADPYLIAISINAGFATVAMNPRGGAGAQFGGEVPWEEGNPIYLGPVVAQQDESPPLAPKRLADLLWQGFHFERCPCFDADGNLIAASVLGM
jgi:hypothetical protein